MTESRDKLLSLTALHYEALPTLMEQMQQTVNAKGSSDSISLILRCHLLTEVMLDKLLRLCLEPNGDAVLAAKLRYAQKLDIASKCMLFKDYELIPSYVISSLRHLNKLRNHLSHNLNASITQEEALGLFQGIEYPMPFDKNSAEVSMLVYQYTSFIFGNMLPKYEAIEEDA
jgi:hypothetical protein